MPSDMIPERSRDCPFTQVAKRLTFANSRSRGESEAVRGSKQTALTRRPTEKHDEPLVASSPSSVHGPVRRRAMVSMPLMPAFLGCSEAFTSHNEGLDDVLTGNHHFVAGKS